MDHRKVKKIIIAVVFFAIIGVIASSGYFIWFLLQDKPTCFDGILNQDEEMVDCGGVCLMECEKEKDDIILLSYKIIPTLPGRYNMALKLHNPNLDHGSEELNYKLDFFDESNLFIGSYRGSTYILPAERKSVVINALSFSIEPKNVKIEFDEIVWLKVKEFGDSYQINVKDKFYKELTGQTAVSEVRGAAVNRSDFDFDKVDVNILLFDANKNIIDAATTEIRSLLSGEEREFIVGWFYSVAYPSSIEIYAETNVFKSENFMKRYGEAEKFQEL